MNLSFAKFPLLLFLLMALSSPAHSLFRKGPVFLDEMPEVEGKFAARAERIALMGENLPAKFLETAREITAKGEGLLIVGHTDSTGPKLLNRSLGLQYAIYTANRLGAILGVEPWKFFCASAGESTEREDVWVEIFPWTLPPEPPPPGKAAAIILEPVPEKQIGNRIHALKDSRVETLILATRGPEGETLWEAPTLEVLAQYF